MTKMEERIVRFKKIHPNATIPTYAREGDAGMDMYSVESITIPSKGFGLVKTGLQMELPNNTEAQVRSRSGLALKNGVFVLNSPGTVDQGYRGELGVILANLGESDYTVNVGDRVAQMVISDLLNIKCELVEELSTSERGTGGFGSTSR
jgi:dUTP pyrophosphatase